MDRDVTEPDETVDLPGYTGILVVDSCGFSRHNDLQQDAIAGQIPDVLRRACEYLHLAELWDRMAFPDSTGDGFMMGFPTRLLPHVVRYLPEALQRELRETNRSRLPAGARLRMRLSIDVGPVGAVPHPMFGSPVGKTMIDTHRVVDADVLRALLERSDPEITYLVAAISEQVMEVAVRSGRSTRRVSEFVRVTARVNSKDFEQPAYLRVPVPSGDLLRYGLLGVQPSAEDHDGDTEQQAPRPETASETTETSSGEQHRGEHIHAEQGARASRVGDVSGGSTVLGDVGGDVGTVTSGSNNRVMRDVDQSSTTYNTGRDHYQSQGDMNFGRKSGRRYHPEQGR